MISLSEWVSNFLGRAKEQLNPELEYYLYKSDAKIKMLWDQLDASLVDKYSGELKFTIGVVEATSKAEKKDLNSHQKMQLIIRHLEQSGQLGPMDSGKPYVYGTLPMTWQKIDFYRGASAYQMVLFAGRKDREQVIDEAIDNHPNVIALIGSEAYFAGGDNGAQPATLGYTNPLFWNRISESLADPLVIATKTPLIYGADSADPEQLLDRHVGDVPTRAKYLTDPEHNRTFGDLISTGFVARRFTVQRGVLVGSPIYMKIVA